MTSAPEVPEDESPGAGLPPLHRALRLSIPAAAMASVPVALKIRESLTGSLAKFGLPVASIPRWILIVGLVLLCALVAATSFEAVRTLVLSVRQPFPRYALLLFNILALLVAFGVLVITAPNVVFLITVWFGTYFAGL